MERLTQLKSVRSQHQRGCNMSPCDCYLSQRRFYPASWSQLGKLHYEAGLACREEYPREYAHAYAQAAGIEIEVAKLGEEWFIIDAAYGKLFVYTSKTLARLCNAKVASFPYVGKREVA